MEKILIMVKNKFLKEYIFNKKILSFSFLVFTLFALSIIFGQNFWKSIGVPALNYPFGDFNVVKNSYHLYSQGLNISEIKYLKDTTIFNYPKVWIYISKYFNLYNELNSSIFIYIMILCYIYVYLYFIKKTNSFIPIIFFFSGSSLLLIERGNIDLIIFFMIFLISMNKKYISEIAYLTASILKIFPVVLLPFFMKKKIINGLIVLPVLFYLFLINDQLKLISSSTPMSSSTSYGSLSISIIIERYLNFEINHLVISFVLVISSILVYFILASKLKKQNKHNVSFENMFICGGIIYVSTFLVAANWDYRLVFISFCFPYMSIQNNFFKFLFVLSYIVSMHYTILYDFLWIYGSTINQGAKIILFFLISIYLIKIFRTKISSIEFY